MAGEKRGLAYEALVAILLENCAGGKVGQRVHWNVTPKGMDIDPDFTLGDCSDAPTNLILVSFPASYNESNRKFWRGIAELWESKVFLATPPQVTAIQFGGGVKEDLNTLSGIAFDAFVHFSEDDFGPLLTFVDGIAPRLPAAKEEKTDEFRRLLAAASSVIRQNVRTATERVRSALQQTNNFSSGVWRHERKSVGARCVATKPARITHFRRGAAKLILAENAAQVAAACRGTARCGKEPVLRRLGCVKDSLIGSKPCDPELVSFCRSLSPAALDRLNETLKSDSRLRIIAAPLGSITAVEAAAKYLAEQWNQLRDPKILYQEMCACHKDPLGYARIHGAHGSTYVRPGLVAEMVFELLRVALKRRQAFGRTGIIQALGQQGPDTAHGGELKSLAKQLNIKDTQWRSATTVSYGFRDWLFGTDRTNFSLTVFEILRVAYILGTCLARPTAEKPGVFA